MPMARWLIALALCLALVPTGRAAEAPSSDEGRYVKQLVEVLNSTRSVDTFVVTLGLLEKVEGDLRPAVPVVIRNAERLGLFSNHFLGAKSNEAPVAEVARGVIVSLERMAGRRGPTGARTTGAVIGAGVGAITGGAIGAAVERQEKTAERRQELSRRSANHAFAPQVMNGHVLDQTVWNTDFEPGSDRLTEGGLAHLQQIARRRPCPDRNIYLATAHDLKYGPNCPDRYCGARQELDALRKAAVLKYLAGTNGAGDFTVVLHDPPDVGTRRDKVAAKPNNSADDIVPGPPGIEHGCRLDSDESLLKRIRAERLKQDAKPATKGRSEDKPEDRPIRVPPWVTEKMEEKYAHKDDIRTPIMPPIKPGSPPPLCEDEPDDSRILRAWPKFSRRIPGFYEERRANTQIVKELLVDKIDPPRFFPLVGMAQLHHCHWKITIYYDETIESGWPFPYSCTRPRVQVIYMDLDHLHQYVGEQEKADLTGRR